MSIITHNQHKEKEVLNVIAGFTEKGTGNSPTITVNKIERFDPSEAVKQSKGGRMDYIAQFRVINPHQ